MHKYPYSEAIKLLEVELALDGFVCVKGEIFTGRKVSDTQPWLSLAGNDFLFSPVLGVCSIRVDNLVAAALKKVLPRKKADRLPVPLFRGTPRMIAPPAPQITEMRRGQQPGYHPRELTHFLAWLRSPGYKFLSEHASFEAALRLALQWNRHDQAQQYYIPALLVLLERQSELDDYAAEVTARIHPEAKELSSLYARYISEISTRRRRAR